MKINIAASLNFGKVFGRGTKPNSREIKDLLALGLVGGGMKDVDADLVIAKGTPADLLRLFQIAQAVLGVAFMPDVTEAADVKKNTVGQPQSN